MPKKHLVIVESPAKAKTIEKYLGSEYLVKSSFGHIRDLPKKGLNIDIKNNFAPTYEINPDKKKIVNDLKKATKLASEVLLASDEDREGEAIAWHLTQALGLDAKKTKRIVFHEITKPAIEHAIKNPRTIDMKLIDAQQARRVLDRLVGYELSPVLWKKVRTGLSAGRVQSVAVRLCVEREREIRNFNPTSSYKVAATFNVANQELVAFLINKLTDIRAAREFLGLAKESNFTVESIIQKPGIRSPSAPFTTSTLQQEAANRLNYSVRQTMQLAQRLYEAGHITYMRTDSLTISELAIKDAEKYILQKYGKIYHKSRQFKTKQQSAQEAHEAIRPTNFNKFQAGEDAAQQKLYQLIWQRALASQMAEAKIERTEITINVSESKEKFLAKGEVLDFDGFMKVYGGTKSDVILPPVKKGDVLKLNNITANEVFSRPSGRYSEASLVRKLEELGIGRPSTYAPTISTIQTRGYIEKIDFEGTDQPIKVLVLKNQQIEETQETERTGAERNKLAPTSLAEVTTDFLFKYFPNVVNYDFTANVEEDFDRIASGKQEWVKMISDFYKHFHPLVIKSEEVSRQEVSQARLLGKDPKTNKPIFARFGRFGPMLQLGESKDKDEKLDFAPLPEGSRLEDVTLEQALSMFELPKTVGKTEKGEEISANIGRFGPYIKVGKVFVSIKPLDPRNISLSEARKLYAEKLKKEADKYINEFSGGIKVIKGLYGPYITDGKKNVKVPLDIEPASLSEAQSKKLLDEAPSKRKFRRKIK